MGVPIQNARDTLLSQNTGTLPNMQDALMDWLQPLLVIRVVKTLVNYQVVERGDAVAFQGVIQPLTGKKLQVKTEGQRSWDWSMIHSLTSLGLTTDDIVWIQNTRYRVMAAKNFRAYGYYYYEVIEDYQNESVAPPVPNENAEKFSEDFNVTSALEFTVDVSEDISNAFSAIWKLIDLDHDNAPVIGAITVLDEATVQIDAPSTGHFRLLGVS